MGLVRIFIDFWEFCSYYVILHQFLHTKHFKHILRDLDGMSLFLFLPQGICNGRGTCMCGRCECLGSKLQLSDTCEVIAQVSEIPVYFCRMCVHVCVRVFVSACVCLCLTCHNVFYLLLCVNLHVPISLRHNWECVKARAAVPSVRPGKQETRRGRSVRAAPSTSPWWMSCRRVGETHCATQATVCRAY